MRNLEELKRAHDSIVSVILDSTPLRLSDKDKVLLSAQADALCWVLEHENNNFEYVLKVIDETLERMGWELVPVDHKDN